MKSQPEQPKKPAPKGPSAKESTAPSPEQGDLGDRFVQALIEGLNRVNKSDEVAGN